MYVLSINVPTRKKSGNLFNDPRIYIYIYILFVNTFCRKHSELVFFGILLNGFKYCYITVTLRYQLFDSTQNLFDLTHRKDPIKCYHSRSKWTWKQ